MDRKRLQMGMLESVGSAFPHPVCPAALLAHLCLLSLPQLTPLPRACFLHNRMADTAPAQQGSSCCRKQREAMMAKSPG